MEYQSQRFTSHHSSSHYSKGITDLEGAKKVAQKMFEQYDRDRDNNLNGSEISTILSDIYRGLSNKPYTPTSFDVDTYSKVCDINKDGRVTYQDIEDCCIKYLTGGIGFFFLIIININFSVL